MNTQKLKGLIVSYDGDQASLAKAMGISRSRFNAKLHEREGAQFSRSDIVFIRDRYNLSQREVEDIFFS